jgi:exodeoxyribonuclease-3
MPDSWAPASYNRNPDENRDVERKRIRARQEQLLELVEREQPDVLCLQEIKASSDQVPARLRDGGILVLLARNQEFRGRLHVSGPFHREACLQPPGVRLRKPDRDGGGPGSHVCIHYVPNGGKDFPAKMRFLEALQHYTADLHAGSRHLVLCGT